MRGSHTPFRTKIKQSEADLAHVGVYNDHGRMLVILHSVTPKKLDTRIQEVRINAIESPKRNGLVSQHLKQQKALVDWTQQLCYKTPLDTYKPARWCKRFASMKLTARVEMTYASMKLLNKNGAEGQGYKESSQAQL